MKSLGKFEKTLAGAKAFTGDDGAMLMADAPHGMGLLITGGYGNEKIGQVAAAHDRDEGGRRVRPKGYGKNADSHDDMTTLERRDLVETDWAFARRIRFPKKDALTDYEKEEILKDLIRENTEGAPESTDGWDENSVVRIEPSTVRCLLCGEPIVTRTWTWQTAQQHFLSRHKALVRRAWKASAPAIGAAAIAKIKAFGFS